MSYEGWHEDFDSDGEALNCFMSGLTPNVRLRVVRRGGFECRWTAEIRVDDKWESVGTVALVLVPFWRRRSEVVLRNRWIDPPAFPE